MIIEAEEIPEFLEFIRNEVTGNLLEEVKLREDDKVRKLVRKCLNYGKPNRKV